ncbi:hypothetical protein AaE_008784 [Aphanomyces astaci]|uniref:Elicitin n=1 Tax=Aphanomyces astaci TaxID=112090 RepID=A0A6A5A6E7_APHAT|nr:hypothetical protein AaE_008784 [Aphanomyces astaci]
MKVMRMASAIVAAMTTTKIDGALSNCTDIDYAPLELQARGCSTASGTNFEATSINLTQAVSMCQFAVCKSLFSDLGALDCTEADIPVSLAATICNSYVLPPGTTSSASSSAPPPGQSSAIQTGLCMNLALAAMITQLWAWVNVY